MMKESFNSNAVEIIAVENGFINMGECENEDGTLTCFQSNGKIMNATVVNKKGEILSA